MAESKKYEFAVTAVPQYIADQSDPVNDNYVFAYTITIENVGTVAAQLISRHWIITDAGGEVREVRGLGVVGLGAGEQRPEPATDAAQAAAGGGDGPSGIHGGRSNVSGPGRQGVSGSW